MTITTWNLGLSGYRSEVWLMQNGTQFVARFKYARPRTNARAFMVFLQNNFTPDEYFAAQKEGKAPLQILESKGFVSPNRAAALRLP